jgi:membrane protein YdbS with pleckstrin-like domain
VAAVVAAAAGAVILRNRFRSWAYREREEDLIVARGVLVRRISVVPYGRMQFVEVTAGPVERAFKLATVQGGALGTRIPEVIVVVVLAVAAVVRWLVTRWRLEGGTLRIETGLLRRDSRQLPVTRIQSVDVVRPFLARAFGLAELRIRLAGSSDRSDGRLAYLTEKEAASVRAMLLARHYGLDPASLTGSPSSPSPPRKPFSASGPARWPCTR